MTIPLPVLIHLVFCAFALVAVPVAMMLPRTARRAHRIVGRMAALGLVGAAFSALFVAKAGPSPLHGLAVMLLVTVGAAVVAARRGRIAAHRRMMLIAAGSLFVAGAAATFIPGRVAYRLVFG